VSTMTTAWMRSPRGPARRRAVTAAALVLAATLAAACTGNDDKQRDQPAPGGGGQPQRALATVPGDVPGLILSAGSLTREGGEVTLRFTVTNQNQATTTLGDLLTEVGKAGTSDTAGVHLYDGNTRKRYNVLRDQSGACRCSNQVPLSLEPGQSAELSATFPDPGQTGEVSALVPHFAPLDGLKIQG
jgi:hypothetical protein